MYMITFHSVDPRENKGTKTWLSLSFAASSYHSWKLSGDHWLLPSSLCGLNIILLNPVLRRFSRLYSSHVFCDKIECSSKNKMVKNSSALESTFLKFNGIQKSTFQDAFGTYACCISAPSFTLSILFLYFRKTWQQKCCWERIYRIEARGWFIPPETFAFYACGAVYIENSAQSIWHLLGKRPKLVFSVCCPYPRWAKIWYKYAFRRLKVQAQLLKRKISAIIIFLKER